MHPQERAAMRNLQHEAARLQAENRELRQDLDALRASVKALSKLHAATAGISRETDVLALLKGILSSAITVVKASEGSLLLRDEDTEELVFAIVIGESSEMLTGYRLPPGQGIAGWVAAHRQPQIVRDAHQDRRFASIVDETFDVRTRSLVAVPLVDDGRVLGVIEVINKVSDQLFSEDDLDLLLIVAQLAARAIVMAEAVV